VIISSEVESLFAEALLEPAERRRAWLDARSAQSPDAVATVRQMLEASHELEGSSGGDRRDSGGLRRGPFAILGLLGAGSHGSVYLARRDSMPDRLLALKVLHPNSGGALLARFRSEQAALSMLDHPGIARIIDVGEFSGHEPWIAMSFVPGQPIDAYCTEGNVPADVRVRLVADVCEAVAYAHRRGLIHRDIKPPNVLVSGPAATARSVVIDFGVAKVLHQDALSSTIAGMPIGTPAFMAPEQAAGAPATTSMDTYGLGNLLHIVLAGRPRFRMDSSAHSGAGIARAIEQAPIERMDELPRGTSAALDGLPASRVRQLEAVIARATAIDPNARYSSTDALAADLRRWIAGETPDACAPSIAESARAFRHRHRRAVNVGGAILMLLMFALLATLFLGWQSRRDRERWEELYEFSRGMLVGSDGSAITGESMPRIRAMASATKLRFPIGSGAVAEELLLGEALSATGSVEDAEEYGRSAASRMEAAGLHGLPLARACMVVARARNAHYDFPESHAWINRSLAEARAVLPPFDRRLADLEIAGMAMQARHDVMGSILRIEDYRDRLAVELGASDPRTLRASVVAAATRTMTGRADLCLEPSRDVAAATERLLGPTNPITMNARFNLTLALSYAGHSEECVELMPPLLADYLSMEGPRSMSFNQLKVNYASDLRALGRKREARQALEEAFAAFCALYEPCHPRAHLAGVSLIDLLIDMGCEEDARETARLALDDACRARSEWSEADEALRQRLLGR
jgi:serine/threonine-protein kinase